jgi:hypothetical protein
MLYVVDGGEGGLPTVARPGLTGSDPSRILAAALCSLL